MPTTEYLDTPTLPRWTLTPHGSMLTFEGLSLLVDAVGRAANVPTNRPADRQALIRLGDRLIDAAYMGVLDDNTQLLVTGREYRQLRNALVEHMRTMTHPAQDAHLQGAAHLLGQMLRGGTP